MVSVPKPLLSLHLADGSAGMCQELIMISA